MNTDMRIIPEIDEINDFLVEWAKRHGYQVTDDMIDDACWAVLDRIGMWKQA